MSSHSSLSTNSTSTDSLKREYTEILSIDDSQTDSQQDSQINLPSTPPKKKRKISSESTISTPILTPISTPSPTKKHNHSHNHKHNNESRIPIIRCKSGHGMKLTKKEWKINFQIICSSCEKEIKPNEDYYKCPKNNNSDSLCITCFHKEKQEYTGAITLGQRVRIKVRNEWKLGSILKHWPDDDMYTIQIDGQKRQQAEAYDIYDAFWEIQLVNNKQLKPTPTRILTQIDSDSPRKTVPRCLSGCRMMTMDAETVYKSDGDDIKDKSDDDDNDIDTGGGIFCNKCGDHIAEGKIYHCPNKSHLEGGGYDLCLKCCKKLSKLVPKLSSYDLNGLSEFILSNKCNKIGILCGAGISRSAGIPDFRSKDGIYKTLSKDLGKNVLKYGLTLQQKKEIEDDTQYVFSIELFQQNPCVLYHVLGDILSKRCKPTLTHCFFKLLQNKGLLKYLFTQNVDGLERYIGIDPNKLLEVHGTFLSASCFKCGSEYNISQLRKDVTDLNIPIKCTKKTCDKGYIKPNCVLFGQDLPQKYYDAIDMFKKNKYDIDLLIVMGTSLSVEPISNLPNDINTNSIRCVLNLDLNEEINKIFKFNKKDNKRDIFIKGKCDQSIMELCKLLKWDKELNQIYKDSNKLNKKINELNDS